ncbi:MAG: peptidylprolyl isomerase [Planctomycetota bacterium]
MASWTEKILAWKLAARKRPSNRSRLGGRQLRLQPLEHRLALTATPVGSPTLVNDVAVRDQSVEPSVMAVAANDVNRVVVYQGYGAVDSEGVFADVTATADGSAVASFRVNTTVTAEQHSPAAAMFVDGGFVVAWAGRGDGDLHGVFFQRFASDGTAVGGETLVNTTVGGVQHSPAVAVASDGSFTVAWAGAGVGDANGVYLQRFNAEGVAQGGEVLVNTEVTDRQDAPALVYDSGDTLYVAWQSRGQDGSGWGVYSQRFNLAGDRLDVETQLNSTTSDTQAAPAVAAVPGGGVVAAWQSRGQDGDGWGVVARAFDASLAATTGEVVLNDTAEGEQLDVAIAVASDGQWLASWSHGVEDGSGWEVDGGNFRPDGTPDGASFEINTDPGDAGSGHQRSPAVAVVGESGVVVWSGNGTPDDQGVYSQDYDLEVEENVGPDLAPIQSRQSGVNNEVVVTVTATDENESDVLTFSLDPDDSPETATIEQTGDRTAVIRWTPTPLEAGQEFSFRVIVTDSGFPPLSDSESFTVAVLESDAADLVGFATALDAANAQFFGAAWSESTAQQRELFEDGGQFLPFTDVTNPDRSLNAAAAANNITDPETPVWVFEDGTRLEGVQSLQAISAASGVAIPTSNAPFIAPLPDETLLAGSPLHVPLDGYDPNGGPLTFTVSSDNPDVSAEIIQGNRSIVMDVEGFGDMTFELFEQRAPRATERVIDLAMNDFYDDLIFHRVFDDFVIQAGSPELSGVERDPVDNFDDQFNVDLQHNRTGLLSFAKLPTDDTNSSQFFVTEGPARSLDFQHSIFGILTEGEDVREAISSTATTGPSDAPVPINDVVINSIDVFTDTENAALMLKADPGVTGTANITVTVTDQNGVMSERTFAVTLAEDTVNGQPFLEDIDPVSSPSGTPAQFQLVAVDVEGDDVLFEAELNASETGNFTVEVTDTGLVTVTPPDGFVGDVDIDVRVRRDANSDGVPDNATDVDSQLVTIEFT